MDDIYVNFLPNVYGSVGISCISCGNTSRVELFFPKTRPPLETRLRVIYC